MATITVNAGGGADYTTISAAVAAATAGDTIVVAAGTYEENVNVNKQLTLEGANQGLSGTDNSRGAETVILGDVSFSASGSTLDGFSVVDGTLTGARLIYVTGDDVTVTNSVISGDYPTDSGTRGILTSGGADNLTVSDNLISDVRSGIYFNVGNGAVVTGNTFESNGNGINADGPEMSDISGNTFIDSVGAQIALGATENPSDFSAFLGANTFDPPTNTVTMYPLSSSPDGTVIDGTVNADNFRGDIDASWVNQGAQTFNGLAGDDTIATGKGDDALNGGAGNDTLDGGAGTDTAIFSGNVADYTFDFAAGTITGPDGTDTFVGIEVFQFDDGNALVVGGDGYATIQDAVNAASAGDVILISAGTYNESVNVNKSLTFIGVGNGEDDSSNTVVTGGGKTGPGNGSGTVFSINADGVSFENLRVADADRGFNLGNGYSNFSIDGVVVDNTDVGIRSGSTILFDGIDVSNSTFSNNDYGMYNAKDGNPARIQNVSFDTVTFDSNLNAAIYSETMEGGSFTDITATNNGTGTANGVVFDFWTGYQDAAFSDLSFDNVDIDNSGGDPAAAGFRFVALDLSAFGGNFGTPIGISNISLDNIEVDNANRFIQSSVPGSDLGLGSSITVNNINDYEFVFVGTPTADTASGDILGTAADDWLQGSRDYFVGQGITTNDNDTLSGLEGDDLIEGREGNDTLDGGDGDDTLVGGAGNDVIDGGAGSDTADYSDDTGGVTATLATNPFNFLVPGTGFATGPDIGIDGLSNIENFRGGTGNDVFGGDGGDNVFYASAGNDAVDGVSGDDTYDASDATNGVTVDLGAGTASGPDIGSDTLTNIDNAAGGAGSDVLTGNSDANTLTGNEGDDTLVGGAGNDALEGGDGTDTAVFSGNLADYTFDLGAGTITGPDGADTIGGIEILEFDDVDVYIVGAGGFGTIQEAVDAASAGDTILIAAGTYNESVVVSKALDFVGAGAGQTIVTPPAGNGFSIQGDLGTTSTLSFEGISFTDSSNGSGIFFDDNAVLGTLEVSESAFSGNFRNGIAVGGNSNPVDLDNAVIVDSTFVGNGGDPSNQTSSGDGDILFFQYYGDATLENLSITGQVTGSGPAENAIQFRGDSGAIGTVTMTNVSIDGVYEKQMVGIFNYDDVDGLSGSGNEITADSTGFELAINIDGVGGDYSLDTLGFDLSGASDPAALQGQSDDNVFTGSSSGDSLLVGNDGDDVLTGTSGDVGLAGGAGTDTAVIVDNGGNPVTDLTGYDFSNVIVAGGAANGTMTVDGRTLTLEGIEIIEVEETGSSTFIVLDGMSIQTAIDAASDGDTILVAPGTYTETANYNPNTGENDPNFNNPLGLLINKQVTIQGFDASGNFITDSDDVVGTVVSGDQSNWGTNFYVTAANVSIIGLELQGNDDGSGVVNKVIEIIEDDFTLQHSIVGAADDVSVAGAVYFNDANVPANVDLNTFVSAITTFDVDGNVLRGSISSTNGVGYGHAPGDLDLVVQNNLFENNPGYENSSYVYGNFGILVTGKEDGIPWRNAPAATPEATGNTFESDIANVLRVLDDDVNNLPTLSDITDFIANNTVEAYAYAETPGGDIRVVNDMVPAAENPYGGDIDTNIVFVRTDAGDASGDALPGDTIKVVSGPDAVVSTIVTDDLNVEALSGSVDLTLELDAAVNDVTLLGDQDVDVNGNANDNTITGNDGDNVLSGGAGDDDLIGISGDDTLNGGEGSDLAVFDDNGGSAYDDADYDYSGVSVTDGAASGDIVFDGRTVTVDGIELLEVANTGSSTFVVLDGMSIQAAIDAASSGDTIIVRAGTYEEQLTIDTDGLTLVGIGDPEINGVSFTNISGWDGTSPLNEFFEANQPNYTASKGITIDADGVSLSGFTITGFGQGVAVGNSAGSSITDNTFINNVTGLRKGTAAEITDFTLSDNTFTQGIHGMTIYAASNGDGSFDFITMDGNAFSEMSEKGMYFEQLSNASLTGNTFDDVGNYGRVAPPFGPSSQNGWFGQAIDINLKYGTYSNVTFTDTEITNSGHSDLDGAADPNGFGAAIGVKIRDDGSYAGNPASFTGEIIFDGGFIDGTSTGVRVGEPGKDNDGPDVLLDGMTIDNATVTDVENATDPATGGTTTVILSSTQVDLDASLSQAPVDITGNALGNELSGGSADDVLVGGEGNDTLDGGLGDDDMSGGLGDDTYVVEGNDTITENVGEGTDTVETGESYTLGANLENLTLTDTAGIDEDFEDFDLGGITDGENGWKNNQPAQVDEGVVDAGGDQVFQMSSDPSQGNFAGPFSPDAGLSAGESTTSATHTGMLLKFTVKAVSPGDDSRLEVDFGTADRTDRANFFVFENTSAGIRIASAKPLLDGNWVTGDTLNDFAAFTGNTTIVEGLDNTQEHEIAFRLKFVDGQDNDLIEVFVDGSKVGEATTFENYWDYLGGTHADNAEAHQAGGIFFRPSAGGAPEDGPGGQNQGFQFDDIQTEFFNNVSGTGNALDNVITGNSGDNALTGLDGADTLIGNLGDDTLEGGVGNDALDGGEGVDTAVFSGNSDDYSIVLGSVTVTDNVGTDGTDTGTDIEILEFQDRNVLIVGAGGFGTIQEAVDAASDGDLIMVAAGTYREQVSVDGFTDLTIRGMGDTTIIEMVDDPQFNNGGIGTKDRAAVISVTNSTNVTIEDVKVDGRGLANAMPSGSSPDFVGIFFGDSSGTIDDTTVVAVRDPLVGGHVSGNQRGNAIFVINDDAVPRDVTISDNTVSDFQKNGITVSGDGVTGTISGNTVTGDGFINSLSAQAQNGIQLSFGAGGTIDGNDISEIGQPRTDFASSYILIYDVADGVQVISNTITGVSDPSYTLGVAAVTANDLVVDGNDISSVLDGIYAGGGVDNPDLDGNTFTDMITTFSLDGYNIDLDGSGNTVALDFTGSDGDDYLTGSDFADILDGGEGDDIVEGGDGDDVLTGTSGNDELYGGAGDDLGIFADNGGDPFDPADFDFSGASGAGGVASGTILDGARTIEVDGIEVLEVANTGSSTFVVLAGMSLQDAIDAASDGDTIYLGSGTHTTGSININKELTIIGANVGEAGNDGTGAASRTNAESVVENSGWVITADNVTVDGLSFSITDGSAKTPIQIQNGQNVVAKNLIIQGQGNNGGRGVEFVTSYTGSGTVAASYIDSFTTGIFVNPVNGGSIDITQNVITNHVAGIGSDGMANTTVEQNYFNGNSSEAIGASALGTGVEINGNSFNTPGTAGLIKLDYGGYTNFANSDANWFGTANGSTIATLISENLSVSTYLTDGTDTSNDPGFQGDGASDADAPVENTTQGTGYFTLALGIAAANDSDTLTVAAGDYAGEGDITVDADDLTVDLAAGTSGVSFVLGAASDITLTGDGDGDVTGNASANVITGNNGDNVIAPLGGNDTVDAGGGTDLIDFSNTTNGVLVDLETGQAFGGAEAGVNTISNFENMIGGSGSDSLSGDAGDNVIFASGGNDQVNGRGGIDTYNGASTTQGFGANLAANFAGGSEIGFDTLSGIENLVGGSGNDLLTGDGNDNVLTGNGGNDTIIGGAGMDTLTGDAGNDTLTGGDDADTLDGGEGNDTLNFGAGDTLSGGAGNDTANAQGTGISFTFGDDGIETINGTTGNDTLNGAAFTTAVTINGSDGDDVLTGGSNNDVITGGAGSDELFGGAGRDMFHFDGSDTIDGGSAYDYAFADGSGINVAVGAGGDLVSVEWVTGTVNADVLDGTNGQSDLTLVGDNGNDILTGSHFSDTLNGQNGDDTLVGGYGLDTLYGGNGKDSLEGGFGTDWLYGGDGNDTLDGDEAADLLDGGAGNDVIHFDGDDTVEGGVGNDRAYGADSGVTASFGGVGENTGIETVYGGTGNDVFDATNSTVAITITGRDGNDTVTGGSANDTLYGGNGNDTLSGGAGNDQEFGGAGYDKFIASLGNDTLNGQGNVDSLDATAATSSVTVDLSANTASGADIGNDAIYNIEIVFGGSGDDMLTGDGNDNSLYGRDGEDTISGGDGNDALSGNGDDDFVEGGNGSDLVVGGSGVDELHGDAGNDTLSGGEDRDELTGGTGSDTFNYDYVSESAVGVSTRDVIYDFVSGTDKLDMTDIAFTSYGGETSTFTTTNQLILDGDILKGSLDGSTTVFEIDMNGVTDLDANDFIF